MISKFFDLHPVADGVYAAIVKLGTGAWGNAGIIDLGGKTVVFDTFATPEAARDLKRAAEELTGRPVSMVINSHRHIDHVGGNQVFEGAEVLATAVTRDLIATRTAGFLEYGREHPELLAETLASAEKVTDPHRRREAMNTYGEFEAIFRALPEYQLYLPTILYEGRLTLKGTLRSAELFCPGGGHTASDSVLWLPEERILFAGDLVQVGFHPSTGQGSYDDWKGGILDQLGALAPVTVVPGHGPVGDGAAIPTMQQYFTALAELADQGSTADEIAIPEAYREWECPSVVTDSLRLLIKQAAAAR